MNEAGGVRVRDGIRYLDGELYRAAHVHRAPGHLGAQRLPLEKLKHEVQTPVLLPHVEDGRHVRMRHRGH